MSAATATAGGGRPPHGGGGGGNRRPRPDDQVGSPETPRKKAKRERVKKEKLVRTRSGEHI